MCLMETLRHLKDARLEDLRALYGTSNPIHGICRKAKATFRLELFGSPDKRHRSLLHEITGIVLATKTVANVHIDNTLHHAEVGLHQTILGLHPHFNGRPKLFDVVYAISSGTPLLVGRLSLQLQFQAGVNALQSDGLLRFGPQLLLLGGGDAFGGLVDLLGVRQETVGDRRAALVHGHAVGPAPGRGGGAGVDDLLQIFPRSLLRDPYSVAMGPPPTGQVDIALLEARHGGGFVPRRCRRGGGGRAALPLAFGYCNLG
mmetsp:Transcript_29019/g.68022  ORF Transcript_29019/g.68022 Transcript_29019/m.68022 type:complete len:259 (-) Transcript_29019:825-1601(-)